MTGTILCVMTWILPSLDADERLCCCGAVNRKALLSAVRAAEHPRASAEVNGRHSTGMPPPKQTIVNTRR